MTNEPIEFERKFRIKPERVNEVLGLAHYEDEIHQGYFMEDDERCVRIRRQGTQFFLTFKVKTEAVGKAIEIEMPCAEDHAIVLRGLCRTGVHKRRHLVDAAGFLWEIDLFLDHNNGLVLAEVELTSDEESARLSASLPDWIAYEVTGQPEYFNTWLAANTLDKSKGPVHA